MPGVDTEYVTTKGRPVSKDMHLTLRRPSGAEVYMVLDDTGLILDGVDAFEDPFRAGLKRVTGFKFDASRYADLSFLLASKHPAATIGLSPMAENGYGVVLTLLGTVIGVAFEKPEGRHAA